MADLKPGDRLRELLQERGMTQTGLARRLGWTQPAVGALLSGAKTASIARWQEVAEALGVDVQELFGPPPERVTVKVAGAELSGPVDTISKVLAVVGFASPVDEDAAAALAEPAMREKRRPNPRHTGILAALDLVDAGRWAEETGLELSPQDELGLRTYGRSGPPVASLDEAIDLVHRWRAGREGRAPELDPEPGVVELERSADLRAVMGVTDEEIALLRQWRCGGVVRTARQALHLLEGLRAADSGTGY